MHERMNETKFGHFFLCVSTVASDTLLYILLYYMYSTLWRCGTCSTHSEVRDSRTIWWWVVRRAKEAHAYRRTRSTK